MNTSLRFIDLFAGLGGFHLALRHLGHTCVFACEIDETLRRVYKENFGIEPYKDIRDLKPADVPAHDIMCAGFPCQPFSKAGEQDGFGCKLWGDLFEHVIAILSHRKPEFVLLENVPNLTKHDEGRTWKKVIEMLRGAGYESAAHIFSPHEFGVPQIRQRVYIVARRGGLQDFAWPKPQQFSDLHINSVLATNPPDAKPLPKHVVECLKMWQRFIKLYPKDEELPTFPIWAMEFGANYPFEESAPISMKPSELRKFRGAYGLPLTSWSDDELPAGLPPYAQGKEKFPDWKVDFIRKNRKLYRDNKAWIDCWKDELLDFPPSLQKLEWNCKGGERDIWNYVVQFRASGVRVKKPSTAPSLIAMTVTQVPIIAWEKRYMTPRECAKLQSMESLKVLPVASTAAYKALGNAINVRVMHSIASALSGSAKPVASASNGLLLAAAHRKNHAPDGLAA
jgi:DNA (cytosine-5)-methyltransferase 1